MPPVQRWPHAQARERPREGRDDQETRAALESARGRFYGCALKLGEQPARGQETLNILHEASYAMDAPGGDPAPSWPHSPPSSAHFQPQGNHVFLRTTAAAPCARGFYL